MFRHLRESERKSAGATQAATKALRGGPRYDVEHRVVRPGGEVRIVHSQGDVLWDESGRPRRMFGTVQDITERKRAEQERCGRTGRRLAPGGGRPRPGAASAPEPGAERPRRHAGGHGPAARVTDQGPAHESGQVLVAVQDAGVGLDPQSLARLFEPFYMTRPEGIGLGLPISRSIIEVHGGRLWATPHDGPGATMQFTLPTGGEQVS